MHSEDDDYNLPIAFQQRRHEPIEGFVADLMKNWRLKSKERVSLLSSANPASSLILSFTDENSFRGTRSLLKHWS